MADLIDPPATPIPVSAAGATPPGWRSLDPATVIVGRFVGAAWTVALSGAVGLSVVTMLLSGEVSRPGAVLVMVGAALLVAGAGGLAWFVPERRFRYTRYRPDEHGIVIHRGRLFHAELVVLRSRIQHTEVTQGPVERLFGLGTLVVYTAGSAHAAIGLSGVSFREARRLRSELTGSGVDDVV